MNSNTNITDIKKLTECKRSAKVKVVKLNAPSDLKQRLISFGIMKEAVLEVLEHAPAKSTLEIKVAKMSIALRAKEADHIMVQEI